MLSSGHVLRRPVRTMRIGGMGLSLLSLVATFPMFTTLSAAELPSVLIEGDLFDSDQTPDAETLAFDRVTDSDTAALLPGTNVAQGGGVSGLPIVHGLGDDRVRTLVDGMPLSATCPMHMNPPLSYIDPSAVDRVAVLPGVTPVSLGGDSIGGTIVVQSASPAFAPDDKSVLRSGTVSTFYRSNASTESLSANAAVASSDASVSYDGSAIHSADYHDGRGDRILASRLEDSNQQLTLAFRDGTNVYEAQAGVQDMPYEGFPNSDMDLSGNVAAFINLRYWGDLPIGKLSVSGYFDSVHHQMNGDAPDRYPPSPVDITSMGLMPTRERGEDYGYRVELAIPSSARATVRLGSELHGQNLDDRWPGAPLGMPSDYVSLNHASRVQLGTFAEWQRGWGTGWSALLGVRNDTIWMNTGPVQGYDGIDPVAAEFNARPRARTDVNFDATALARYQPDDTQSYELGIARKNRSPNLYERYAWGTSTIGMIGWFGDGNGYTGNPDLKPETAYALSASGEWHGPGDRWRFDLTPYYTRVRNYIGVISICSPQCSGMPAAQLMFANHEARLYGTDADASYALATRPAFGTVRLTAAANFVRGRDLTTGSDLYRMMPPNGTIGLEDQRGRWLNRLEVRIVAANTRLDTARLEPPTGGFATVTLRSAYIYRALRLDLAVTNLFNRQYADPLAGRWQSGLYPPGFMGTIPALPAMGRSIDVGLTVGFE
jgi:iron complex outermembrane recepter protein